MTAPGTAQYHEEEIRRALAKDPRVGELELVVSIHEDEVTVRGAVPTAHRRDEVAAVVRELAPGLRFVDRLEVADEYARPAPGEEEPIA